MIIDETAGLLKDLRAKVSTAVTTGHPPMPLLQWANSPVQISSLWATGE